MFHSLALPSGIRSRNIRHARRVYGDRLSTGIEQRTFRVVASLSQPDGTLPAHKGGETVTPFAVRRSRAFAHGSTSEARAVWSATGPRRVVRQHIDANSAEARAAFLENNNE